MKLKTFINFCTPKTRLKVITRTRVVSIHVSSTARTQYALQCYKYDVTSIKAVDENTIEVRVDDGGAEQ